MAVTITKLANQAFVYIGLDEVEELAFEKSAFDQVIHFKNHYDSLRRSILRKVPWSFATETAELELAGIESKLQDYSYVYKLPKDCLYARRIDKRRDGEPVRFRIIKKYLYTNEINPVLEYTRNEEDVTEFDASFEIALCHRIAAELAKSICLDMDKMQAEMQFYQIEMDSAMTETQRESKEEPKTFNPIFNAMTS